jgi:hypothetical protein
LQDIAEIETLGFSENGIEIPILKIGSGSKKVLAWSQMHGNESTTTKGLFDFLKFLKTKNLYKPEINSFLITHTFYLIPILNPDGAILNTRENFNKIDLNRDAQSRSQTESRLLRRCFDEIQPNLCLNLHDQRSIFGFENGSEAAISFLAPAADKKRTLTAARITAIKHIMNAVEVLEAEIPNKIGRFDDSFNSNCVGDAFTTLNTPTILLEAGHTGSDYEREISRYHVFLALVGILLSPKQFLNDIAALTAYQVLPENKKNYADLLLKNVQFSNGTIGSVICQFREVLIAGRVEFHLILIDVVSKSDKYAHKVYDLNGSSILINSQENYRIGQKIESMFDRLRKKLIY